ncbi:hypothetical protein P9209_18510 [Prescottella defluvii]|nr:hypothetical protein P9209_18510 [Prescottella defluvii]
MTTMGTGLTVVGFSNRIHVSTYLGIACLTIGLMLILLGALDVGLGGRRHWF